MKSKGRHTKKYIESNQEKDFTFRIEDVIISSMMCLDQAFLIATKSKDSKTLIELSDKWIDLYQSIIMDDEEEVIEQLPFGFVPVSGDIDE